MAEEHYYIRGKADIDGIGHFLRCRKCGKKVIVEMMMIGARHHGEPIMTCAECMVVCDEFKENYPEQTKLVEEFIRSDDGEDAGRSE